MKEVSGSSPDELLKQRGSHKCPACKDELITTDDWCCERCVNRYGPVLIKAIVDEFDYAVGLVSGEVIRFTKAETHGDWVTLGDIDLDKSKLPAQLSCPERGLDVRISQIAWACDAPQGS